MFSWTEKVAGKLSRQRSDSASSRSKIPKESDVFRAEIQDRLSSEENSSSRTSKLSSYIYSFIPASLANVDTQKLSNIRHMPLPSLPSLPKRWKNQGFLWDQHADKEHDHASAEASPSHDSEMIYDVFTAEEASPTHVSAKISVEAASPSNAARSFSSAIEEESSFITEPLFEFLESSLPNLVKSCQWILIYSTQKHGISLRTLFRRTSDFSGPCLLIVGDMQGAVFGGLLDAPLKPTSKRKYQGNFQTFVFTTKYGDPRLFRPTGENRYYYLCMDELLALGGGGNFALRLDEDLLHGTSGPCDTFGSSCLAHTPEFEVKNVELWGFAHSWHTL